MEKMKNKKNYCNNVKLVLGIEIVCIRGFVISFTILRIRMLVNINALVCFLIVF